ncbi:NucA/NucB deoxyribonuclease domain-containing protein [Rhodococcus qingshengii]|uniref:NucA/NucB deoxyribonuclease domain-containing protein n=1 Tax=Rhodococcus qingshengii TaxID=334542 RepID=UPI0030183945
MGPRDGIWRAYRKQSCSITNKPFIGRINGVVTTTRPLTIFQGILTSQKSGEWRQEFRIQAGADIGIADIQTFEFSVDKRFLGSWSTELNESTINIPLIPGQTRSVIFIWKPILTDNGIFNFQPVLNTYINSAEYKKTNVISFKSDAVRCDTTLKKGGINGGYRPGCVIPRVRPELNFDDQSIMGDMTEQAGHIGLAIESGLPGSRARNQPLTRMADKTAIDNNRRVSCPTSGKIRDGRFLAGHECDEYPFAATYQGSVSGGGSGRTFQPECHVPDLSAGSGSVGYSICMISALHNSRGGSALLKLYAYNRVIGGDPFFVYGTPSRPQ